MPRALDGSTDLPPSAGMPYITSIGQSCRLTFRRAYRCAAWKLSNAGYEACSADAKMAD
jgi:hypothetical protein